MLTYKKHKTMTKKFSILPLIVFGAILLSSCSDYLDSDKYFKDRTTIESVFTNKAHTEEWLVYAYSFLKNQCADVCSKDISTSSHCFADDMYYGDRDVKYDPTTSGSLSYNAFKLGEYDEDSFNEAWGRCYKGIYQASVFIHNIDLNKEMTDTEKLDYKGQARFVRAYFYWLLLRKYGPVPIMRKAVLPIRILFLSRAVILRHRFIKAITIIRCNSRMAMKLQYGRQQTSQK